MSSQSCTAVHSCRVINEASSVSEFELTKVSCFFTALRHKPQKDLPNNFIDISRILLKFSFLHPGIGVEVNSFNIQLFARNNIEQKKKVFSLFSVYQQDHKDCRHQGSWALKKEKKIKNSKDKVFTSSRKYIYHS